MHSTTTDTRESPSDPRLATLALTKHLPPLWSGRLISCIEDLEGLCRVIKLTEDNLSLLAAARRLLVELAVARSSFKEARDLPLALREFAELARHSPYHGTVGGSEIRAAAAQITTAVLKTVGTTPLQRHFGTSRHGLIFFGQGDFNWVLGDERDVVYISKGNLKDQTESFFTRRYCTQRMRESNPLHPVVHTVGSLPWSYAIGDTFYGVSIRKFLSSRAGIESPHNTPTREELCTMVGNYLRSAFQHAPDNFGELTFRGGVASGSHSSWYEHSAELLNPWITPTDHELALRNTVCEAFPALTEMIPKLDKAAKRLSTLHEPRGIILPDPSMHNFLFSPRLSTIACVDWDRAAVSYRCEAAGKLLYAWFLSSDSRRNVVDGITVDARRTAFKDVIRAFVPSTEERLLVKRYAIDWLGLRLYWMISLEMRSIHCTAPQSEIPAHATRFAHELAALYKLQSI
jgi:hypothetical protein